MDSKLSMIEVGEIHPFHADENVSRTGGLFKDDKDRDTLIGQLVPGWNPSLGVAGLYKLDPKQVELGVKERTERWEALKLSRTDITLRFKNPNSEKDDSVIITASDLLRAWEATYTLKGKVIPPKYGQVFAFRRVESLPYVNAVRIKRGLDPILTIPATVSVYETQMERFLATVGENTLKLAGARQLSNADQMSAAKRLYMEQAKEADFRRVWKVGMAQKLYAICALDNRFPEAGIVSRIIDGTLDFGPLDKEKVRKLYKDPAATLEQVLNPENLGGPTGNAPKIAPRSDIETMAEQSPVTLIKETAAAIMANDTKRVNRYVPHCHFLNEMTALVLTDTDRANLCKLVAGVDAATAKKIQALVEPAPAKK
jgi:hypothetical protein